MTELFALRLLMAEETVQPFGEGVAAVCVRFPAYTKEIAQAIRDHLVKLEVVSPTLNELLSDLDHNADVATEVGGMIATFVGHSTPERVGTLETKPEAMQ